MPSIGLKYDRILMASEICIYLAYICISDLQISMVCTQRSADEGDTLVFPLTLLH